MQTGWRPQLSGLLRFIPLMGLGAGVMVGCSRIAGLTYEADLANHLRQTGARMYGAYWCPHCAAQKEQFGISARRIPYIECDPQGENSQADFCRAKGIQGYPTWEINGEFYVGVQPLGKLAELSGFEPSSAEASP